MDREKIAVQAAGGMIFIVLGGLFAGLRLTGAWRAILG